MTAAQPISGHVFRFEGKRRPMWRAKYRLPDGRQVKKTIGPAWTERGRPAVGYFTRRTAQAWLDNVLAQARAGTLRGMVRTGVTFGDACDEYLRYVEVELDRKPSTVTDYRSIVRAYLVPAFGTLRLEDLTGERIEAWKATLTISNRSKAKILTILNGVLKRARRVHKLGYNAMANIEKPRFRATTAIEVFSPEEIWALVRAAESEQDGAIFLTAAFTGLRRGELVALRWRDVDFTVSAIRVSSSYTEGHLTRPKSGKVRAVPMAPEVGTALAKLGQRAHWTGDDDLVFPGMTGGYLDASALYRRFVAAAQRAGLRRLRFHDLRHTFGTTMAANPKVDLRRLQESMGHADMATTHRYSPFKPRHDDAALVAEAFAVTDAAERSAPRSTP